MSAVQSRVAESKAGQQHLQSKAGCLHQCPWCAVAVAPLKSPQPKLICCSSDWDRSSPALATCEGASAIATSPRPSSLCPWWRGW